MNLTFIYVNNVYMFVCVCVCAMQLNWKATIKNVHMKSYR